ncbi:hypothetical protein ES703_110688 [subsurface metagenome]
MLLDGITRNNFEIGVGKSIQIRAVLERIRPFWETLCYNALVALGVSIIVALIFKYFIK